MKVDINQKGKMTIRPESYIESYALKSWVKDCKSENEKLPGSLIIEFDLPQVVARKTWAVSADIPADGAQPWQPGGSDEPQ